MVKLVFGVAINDADYIVQPVVNGKKTSCKIYRCWMNMLKRSYSKEFHKKNPTYSDCSVCDEWLTFSNFKAWMERQDWEGKDMDKDLLKRGNKIYSPDFCRFIKHNTNIFITDKRTTSSHLTGAHFSAKKGRYQSYCGNPFTGKTEHLGYFDTEHDAHVAWLKRKIELSFLVAETESDEAIKLALVSRYKP